MFINSLPSEILLIIFNALGHDDLYQLTFVSPSFNRLALIVYFKKRKIPISSEGQADFPNPIKTMEMLPFIRKAPFITSIARFSCGLLQPHKSFLENIQHLITILKNVDSVEEFVIDFFVSSESWTPSMIKQANSRNALYRSLRELLTMASRISRIVMVRNGTSLRGVLRKADEYETVPRSKKLSWSLGPVVSRLFSDKLSKYNSKPMIPPIHSHSYTNNPSHIKGPLRAVEINSIILLSPPFLDWTIQTLNTNAIRELTFGTIEYRDVNWTALLSQLDIPTLATLNFRGYTPFYALIDFMNRHPGVTRLSINNIGLEDSTSYNNNIPSTIPGERSLHIKLSKAFTNIKRLSCCPQGLVTLFSIIPFNNTSPDPITTLFPNVHTISILWSIGLGQKLKMSIIANILSPIAHYFKSYRKLIFVITYRADAGATWCSSALPLIRPRTFDGFHHRSILTTTTNTPYNPDYNNALDPNNTNIAPRTSTLFSEFTEVRLELTPRVDREGIPDLIERLAESLTGVRQFKVDSRSRAGRYPESRLPKAYLVYHILNRFRHLRVVTIDGTRCKH